MINFNVPPHTGKEIEYIEQTIKNKKICGDGEFTKKCNTWLEENFFAPKALLTTSCTSALEMSAILCKIQPGDEVIMPSYTFVSTADAFVMRGATIVFVDINPKTMNIDELKIEAAITEKTKVIVPVHYAGISCNMIAINEIARKYKLKVVEDAAQGMMSTYNGRALGTLGDFGCFSFHETKNYSMGEGGAIIVGHEEDFENAEIIREKGTNRAKFFRGQIDKYTWIDFGSSYLPSDMNAAYLWAQLEKAEDINQRRLNIWDMYNVGLRELAHKHLIEQPFIPKNCEHNAHMYYIKTKDIKERSSLIEFMKDNGVQCVFHYIPLHSAPAGQRFGRFCGNDVHTTKESERLMRLPLYYGLKDEEINYIISKIKEFYL